MIGAASLSSRADRGEGGPRDTGPEGTGDGADGGEGRPPQVEAGRKLAFFGLLCMGLDQQKSPFAPSVDPGIAMVAVFLHGSLVTTWTDLVKLIHIQVVSTIEGSLRPIQDQHQPTRCFVSISEIYPTGSLESQKIAEQCK